MTRCPNGTRRNKKTNECESVTVKKSVQDDYNMFNMLCKRHIMVPTLDQVVKTTWMYNKDCNIFLIGEVHQPHTKCTGTLEMFKALIKENSKLPNRPEIDIMLELTQYSSTKEIAESNVQLSRVRVFFLQCVKGKHCTVRVHWTDPTQTNHAKDIPRWLNELSKTDIFTEDWTKNPLIADQLKTEKDIFKLVTDNRFVMKEIDKASQVNKKFTLAFVKRHFMTMWENTKSRLNMDWKLLVKRQLRNVIDFYTVARMVKSNMKNVIYYAGDIHTSNVIRILLDLNFYIKQQIQGECM